MSYSSCINGGYFLQSSFWLYCRNNFIWSEKTVQYHILWVCAKSVCHFTGCPGSKTLCWYVWHHVGKLVLLLFHREVQLQCRNQATGWGNPSRSNAKLFLMFSFVPFGSTWEAKLLLLPEHTLSAVHNAVAHETVAPLECCQLLDLIIRTRFCNSGFCAITVQPM